MQDRKVAIRVWETLGDVFKDELEVVGSFKVLYRHEVDALPIREVNGSLVWTHNVLDMRELLGHFKAPDNVNSGLSIMVAAPDPRTCCQQLVRSGWGKLTTTDIQYPHIAIPYGLEGCIDGSEVILAALEEVESSVLDVQSLPVSMSHLGRRKAQHPLQLQRHLSYQLVNIIH